MGSKLVGPVERVPALPGVPWTQLAVLLDRDAPVGLVRPGTRVVTRWSLRPELGQVEVRQLRTEPIRVRLELSDVGVGDERAALRRLTVEVEVAIAGRAGPLREALRRHGTGFVAGLEDDLARDLEAFVRTELGRRTPTSVREGIVAQAVWGGEFPVVVGEGRFAVHALRTPVIIWNAGEAAAGVVGLPTGLPDAAPDDAPDDGPLGAAPDEPEAESRSEAEPAAEPRAEADAPDGAREAIPLPPADADAIDAADPAVVAPVPVASDPTADAEAEPDVRESLGTNPVLLDAWRRTMPGLGEPIAIGGVSGERHGTVLAVHPAPDEVDFRPELLAALADGLRVPATRLILLPSSSRLGDLVRAWLDEQAVPLGVDVAFELDPARRTLRIDLAGDGAAAFRRRVEDGADLDAFASILPWSVELDDREAR